ncbi:MAG: hypothetical protein ABR555_08310 [Pyrinomonadaceae bacterium]
MMLKLKFLAVMFACCCLVAITSTVRAQSADTKDTNEDQTNLDTQLYLIVGTNQDVADSKLPASVEAVVKQLRASLPFRNYRLAATLVNRVKNDGHLNLRWLGGPFAAAASSPVNPTFSEFTIRAVRLIRSSEGQDMVQMAGFSYNTRIPIQTGTAIASNAPAVPVINYETTGLSTDISMREGEPVIVGTLNIGPSGDAIILIMAAKRTLR